MRFAANGLYDPEIDTGTGGGHQPRGFDTLTPRFKRFYVIGAKLTVTPQKTTALNNNPFLSFQNPMLWNVTV